MDKAMVEELESRFAKLTEVGHAVAVTRERGTWMTRPDGVPVLITFHPSALLRAPEESKPQAYAAWVQDIALASEYATT